MIEQLLQCGSFGIRRLAGDHMINGAAERVDIAAHIGVAGITGLFRSDIIEGSECCAGDRDFTDGIIHIAAGQSEVHHLHATGFRQHDIGWFDIPMDDTGCGNVIESQRHLNCVVDGFGDSQAAAFQDQVANGASTGEFIGDEVQGTLSPGEEHASDIVVIQLCAGSCFIAKASDE